MKNKNILLIIGIIIVILILTGVVYYYNKQSINLSTKDCDELNLYLIIVKDADNSP